ncbi:MAG: DUF7507 domain-containing protein [Syntrophales bacterium]
MALFRRPLLMAAYPRRWFFAFALAVLFFWTAGAAALTPVPGTPIVNRAIVQFGDANGNSLSAVSNTTSTPISAAPRLHLEKTADSDPVAAGASLTYTLRYENNGNASATGVKVMDTLPIGLIFQSASAGGVYSASDRTVTWNIGASPSGNSGVLTVTVQVQAGLAVGTTITNTANISSVDGSTETVSLITKVGSGSNITFAKSVTPETVAPSGVITYSLTCRNSGNQDALQVLITDRIPGTTAYVTGSATPPGSLMKDSLVWALGTVPAGGQKTVDFQVRVSTLARMGDRIANLATISSTTQTKNSNTVVSFVSSQPLLVLKMDKDTPDPVRAGANVTYTIQVVNSGDIPLTGVALHDPLPAGTSFVSADGGGTVTADGRQVDWTIGTLAVGETKTFKVTVSVDAALAQDRVIENSATATTNETPPQTVKVISRVNARTPGMVEFLDALWQPAYGYMNGDTVYIQVKDPDQNIDPAVAETVKVVLNHTESGDAETIVLTETGPDTGIFRGSIVSQITPAVPNNGVISVSANSRLLVTYTDILDASPVSNASALIDPLGVVFNSVTGAPVAGAVVTLRKWSGVTNTCDFESVPLLQPGQVNPALPTGADGKFAFPLVPAGGYCYQIALPVGYAFPSVVPDAELPSGFTIGAESRGGKFTLNIGDPPLIRDIPIDPPAGQLTITKTAGKTTAAIGDLIGYSIKLSSSGAAPIRNITISDVMPHGVQYIPGSSRIDGKPLADPKLSGSGTFTWSALDLAPGKSLEITYRAVVGPDGTRGTGVNTVSATGISLGRAVVSNTAAVKVRITAGIFTENGTILGKIFLDRDGNRIQNQQENTPNAKKPDEPGIPGVVLYLEDGTRVITDKSGKFSILGVMPGTHVLRVDETTLPKGLALVPLSNRFMGDGASQFVTMQSGGLFQADFAVQGQWPQPDEKAAPASGGGGKTGSSVPLSSAPAVGGEYIVTSASQPASGKAEGAAVPEEAAQPVPATLSPLVPPPSAAEKIHVAPVPGKAAARTVENPAVSPSIDKGEGGVATKGEIQPPAEQESTATIPGDEGAVGGKIPLQPSSPGSRDWGEEIKTMTPDLDFLSPLDGTAVVRERIRVVLKTPFGTEPSLSLNGAPVDAKQIGRKMDYEKGQVTIYEYIDIHLNAGEQNLLRAEVKDSFGIRRGAKQITVTAAGPPERIVIQADKLEAPADGAYEIRVTVSFRDRKDQIVPYSAFATVAVSAGEIVEKDADPLLEDFQIVLREGVGHFTLRAPRETGEAVITVGADGRREEAKVFFTPHLRNLFMVGMGEVKIGLGRSSGEYQFLKDNGWYDDGFYTGGRGAFFMKGKIYEDYLLTAAYDSDKKKRDDLFRENDTNLDTEDKYPIYGDESKTGYEAVSADRLYLKVEKNRSYLLYGDYRTDLNETRLAAYNRSFNGLKYELNTEKFKIRSFGSYTDQTQVMDALPGKGISGYYYLTRRPVIEGSERIVIEVRDRYQPDNVLSRESKGRGSDYEIDYDLGAILFKEPIPSHDGDYNPIYVVASYESKTDGEKYYIYGGRGAFSVFKGLEVGATGIVEEKAVGSYRLMGTDLTLTLPRKTVVKAEYVETKALFEESGIFNWSSDRAWSVNLESQPVEKLSLAGYYRTLGHDFMNMSAVDASRGTTKYGFDAAYELRPDTRIQGKFFDERDDLNSMNHRFGSVGIRTKFKKTKITGEISNESSSDSYIPLTNANTRSPFDISQETPHELTAAKIGIETELRPDLSLTVSHKQNLIQDSYHMSQAGLSYRLNSQNRLYLREEYQKYQDRDEMRTLFGVETEMLKNTVAYNEYRLADGADGSRNQNVLGLRNKFLLGKGVTGNVAAEYLKTVSGAQRMGEPDAVAGSLGLEYLAKEEFKVTSRFEHRRELIDSGRESYLGELGLAYKLHPDYSLLLRERYFTEDAGIGGQQTSSRTMVGVAYRPLLTNRFNALTKLEYKNETNAAAVPSFREQAWIFSGEGIWQATPRLQLTGKYAGKLSRDEEFSVYTDLISGRFIYDLTDRWDIGAEYRLLTSHAVNSRYQGGAIEVGYRVIKNLWVSAGYSFDKFDADLAGDGYQGEGPYLKLRVKFDETAFKKLWGI